MNRLEYILAVIEEKSITKAAKRLYITQPTLTKYINGSAFQFLIKINLIGKGDTEVHVAV